MPVLLLMSLDPAIAGFLTLLGFLVGILAGLIGVGGALMTIPALLYIYPALFPSHATYTMAAITGITATQSLAAGLSSLRVHWKRRNVDMRLVLLVGVTSMIGGFAGGLTTGWYSDQTLKVLYAILLSAISVTLYQKHVSLAQERAAEVVAETTFQTTVAETTLQTTAVEATPQKTTVEMPAEVPDSAAHSGQTTENEKTEGADLQGKDFQGTQATQALTPTPGQLQSRFARRQWRIIAASLGIGYTAGIMGIGGAVFLMPLFSQWLGLPIRMAIGSTTGVIALTCVASVLGKMQSGEEFFLVEASLISIGAILGANIGAKLSFKIQEHHLLILFMVVVFLALSRVLLELVTGV